MGWGWGGVCGWGVGGCVVGVAMDFELCGGSVWEYVGGVCVVLCVLCCVCACGCDV